MWQVGDGTRKSHIPILASGLNESNFFEGKSMVWQLNVTIEILGHDSGGYNQETTREKCKRLKQEIM